MYCYRYFQHGTSAHTESSGIQRATVIQCYQHPLVEGKSERAELIKLLQQDPQEFLKKHRNCLDSIRRYESYLRNPERQNRKEKDRKLLQKYMLRDTLFKEIISNSHERKE